MNWVKTKVSENRRPQNLHLNPSETAEKFEKWTEGAPTVDANKEINRTPKDTGEILTSRKLQVCRSRYPRRTSMSTQRWSCQLKVGIYHLWSR